MRARCATLPNTLLWRPQDGVVVPKEHRQTLIQAWTQATQAEIEKRRALCRERARSNWLKAYRRVQIFLKIQRLSAVRG